MEEDGRRREKREKKVEGITLEDRRRWNNGDDRRTWSKGEDRRR